MVTAQKPAESNFTRYLRCLIEKKIRIENSMGYVMSCI